MSNPKCCAGRLKKFWDQLDSKTPAVNIEEAGHEEELNQDDKISSMRTCTLLEKKIRNVPIVFTFVRYRKIFVYTLKFAF